MIHIMIQNGEDFIWIFGFALKSVVVGVTRYLKQFKLKCEMVTLKAGVTSLIKWGYKGVLELFPCIRENDI